MGVEPLRGVDLFSGIGAASIAMKSSDIEIVAHSEVEPFCNAVLNSHFPYVPNLGDIKQWRNWPWDDLGKIDLITFGSPCQGLSVAGKRKGFSDERSNLFYEAVGAIQRSGARFAIWENVPGAFSSNGGEDFASALDTLADAGALDIAWRVLDAQRFGVPQRRRRIFLVADFGGHRAGEILFESEGEKRDFEPSKQKREEIAGTLGGDIAKRPDGLDNNGCFVYSFSQNQRNEVRISQHTLSYVLGGVSQARDIQLLLLTGRQVALIG